MFATAAKCLELVKQAGGVGYEPRLRRHVFDIERLHRAACRPHFAQERFSMDNADDIVGFVTPERQAGEGAGQSGIDDLGRRQVGVDRYHLTPVGHDFTHRDFRQVEDRAQHFALLPDFGGFARICARMFLNRAAQSLAGIIGYDPPPQPECAGIEKESRQYAGSQNDERFDDGHPAPIQAARA